MSRVDLHIHSTASDGRYSPGAIVAKAAGIGLSVIALTDHDSVEGIAPALETARVFPRLRVIPGIEISTDIPDGEAHVLGYFIDYDSDELRSSLERFRSSRQRRAQAMVAKLRDSGINVDWEQVREIAGEGSIGRPHIAQAMLEKGYITSLKEAFNGYIEQGGPAYVEREKMTPAEAVALIVRSGGLPVLAHPFTLADPEAMVAGLKASGLDGIEAYYSGYTAKEIRRLVLLAEQHELLTTGGSDYHGLDDSEEAALGSADVPMASAERLIALARERGLKQVEP